MRNKVKTIFLSTAFCFCFCLYSYGQFTQSPPEPRSEDMNGYSVPGEECAGDSDGPGTVPVGLCLPINDYLIPLLIVGIILGAYKIQKMETAG